MWRVGVRTLASRRVAQTGPCFESRSKAGKVAFSVFSSGGPARGAHPSRGSSHPCTPRALAFDAFKPKAFKFKTVSWTLATVAVTAFVVAVEVCVQHAGTEEASETNNTVVVLNANQPQEHKGQLEGQFLIPLSSPAGARLFGEAAVRGLIDLRLLQTLVPQPNRFFCGVSSFGYVQRALADIGGFDRFDGALHQSYFDPWPLFENTHTRPLNLIMGEVPDMYPGLGIEDLAEAFLNAGSVCRTVWGTADLTLESTTNMVVEAVSTGGVVVASYDASVLGQSGGHFSPVLGILPGNSSAESMILLADPLRRRNE
jgi:hypothetical protein